MEEQAVNSDNCTRNQCSATFSGITPERNYYFVRVMTSNGLGESSEATASRFIGECDFMTHNNTHNFYH